MILTIAMWVHVILNALVCYRPTSNPIWGELRLIPVIVATAGMWVVLTALL